MIVASPSAARRIARTAWAVGLLSLATSVGCWEEIHYQPGPEEAESPTASAPAAAPEVATQTAEQATPAPATEPSAAAPATTDEPAPPLVLDAPPLDAGPAEAPAVAESAPMVDAPAAGDETPAEPAATPGVESPASSDATGLFGDSPSGNPPAEAMPEEAVAPTGPTATPAERLHIWQATSKWGLAAAMYAKQLPVERFEPFRNEADAAAQDIGIALPPLPIPKSTQTPEQAVVEAFAGERTEAIVATIAERYGADAGALARLALRSNQLLLVYSPKRENVAALASEFTAAAEASGLPKELWGPLAELLDQRAEFVAVRGEVFDFQRRVDEALAAAR